jgi:ethanolamine utilization protein EutP (predicted NTPase)
MEANSAVVGQKAAGKTTAAMTVLCRQKTNKKTDSVAFSPQANYTDWATATAGEVVQTFAGTGCCVVSATNPYNI